MPDYEHMENLIKGETQRITDDKEMDPAAQLKELETMVEFLGRMRGEVLIIKLKISASTPSGIPL